MGIRIDKHRAAQVLKQAVTWALSDQPVSEFWTSVTLRMQSAPSKTYTPALGTALLAKAVDNRVDALSIKDSYAENSYSQRTLCHAVLVPAAVEFGFTLRNTGREPLNNQPFFRYDHMELIDRVSGGAVESLNDLREALRTLNSGKQADALAGLAAFLRVRFTLIETGLRSFPSVEMPADQLVHTLNEFLSENVERPRRMQAIGAAAFDLIFDAITTRKLNDPSRDLPGDVHAYAHDLAIMSAEVRAKPVPATEIQSFVAAVRRAGISRCFVVVVHPGHVPVARIKLSRWAWAMHHVTLTIVESVEELVSAVLAWSNVPVEDALHELPTRIAIRLAEIETTEDTLRRWEELITGHVIVHPSDLRD